MAERPQKRRDNVDPKLKEDPALGILVTAKRMGLSIEELNLLSLDDFMSYMELWAGPEDGASRRATQGDINSILG